MDVGSPPELRADCANCTGLCCVAPAFSRSSDFAIDKPAGHPCPNLQNDFRCGIHAQLRPRGFAGCMVYDCFGAGQKVSQHQFAGRDWRSAPGVAGDLFAVFDVVKQLHELLWYLGDARSREEARPLHDDLDAAFAGTDRLSRGSPSSLLMMDVAAHRERVNHLLRGASELVRAAGGPAPADHRGAELIGARLAGADLRGASFRGASLIGADLRRADLRRADLIGADLRGADLRGADLRDALYVTQTQLNATRGDAATVVPHRLTWPPQWVTAAPPAGSAGPPRSRRTRRS